MTRLAILGSHGAAARDLAGGFWDRALAYDAAGRFPTQNFRELHAAELLAANVPERLGGGGVGPEAGRPLEHWEVTREIAFGDPATAQSFHVHANEIDIILGLGTPEQHELFLAPVVEKGAIFGGYGSQISDSKPTVAQKTDKGWVLNGAKYFCTNSEAAGHALVWALIEGSGDPSQRIQVFYVSHDNTGLSLKRGWWEGFQGMRSTASHVVEFDNAEVDEIAALGAPGDYLRLGLQARAYCQFASSFIGIAERLHAESLAAVEKRKLDDDGPSIARLGSARVGIDAAWGLIERAGSAYAKGEPDAPVKANVARYFAENTVRAIWEGTLDNMGTQAGNAASGVSKLSRDVPLYIRHEKRDKILNTIGRSERGLEFDISFSGDNPILKATGNS